MENKKSMNIVVAVVICVAVVAVLVFISLKDKNEMNPNTNTNVDVGQVNTDAQVAQAGDTVAMNYTGRLADGTVFDSNVDPKFNHVTPFVFTLGAGQVIPGWDKGIVGMKVGEKKTLVIPPADGYGAQDIKDGSGKVIIPANSTLTFDVELLAINGAQAQPQQ